MAVYVDEMRNYKNKGDWCHLWTDGDPAELDAFALALGLQKSWKHLSSGLIGEFPHYDLRPAKRALALKRGAVNKPLREWVIEKLKEKNNG